MTEDRLDRLERRIAEIERRLGFQDQLPDPYRSKRLCGCLPGAVCGNAACPYLPRIT